MQWANTLPTKPRLNQHGEKNSSTNLSLSASGCARSTHITNVVSTQTSGRVSTKKGSIHASRMETYNYPQFWQGHNLKFLLSLLSRKPGLTAACIWSSKCFAKLWLWIYLGLHGTGIHVNMHVYYWKWGVWHQGCLNLFCSLQCQLNVTNSQLEKRKFNGLWD